MDDKICDCEWNNYGQCEDLNKHVHSMKTTIYFQYICDSFIELDAILIDQINHTNEAECEQWMCDNIYTHCNKYWNCPNGEDETNCYLSSSLNCSSNTRLCVSSLTNQFQCLENEKFNEKSIDCLVGTDEPFCNQNYFLTSSQQTFERFGSFYCLKDNRPICLTMENICNCNDDCDHGKDEQFCTTNRIFSQDKLICATYNRNSHFDIELFLLRPDPFPRSNKQIILLRDQNNNPIQKSFDRKTSNDCHYGIRTRL